MQGRGHAAWAAWEASRESADRRRPIPEPSTPSQHWAAWPAATHSIPHPPSTAACSAQHLPRRPACRCPTSRRCSHLRDWGRRPPTEAPLPPPHGRPARPRSARSAPAHPAGRGWRPPAAHAAAASGSAGGKAPRPASAAGGGKMRRRQVAARAAAGAGQAHVGACPTCHPPPSTGPSLCQPPRQQPRRRRGAATGPTPPAARARR